MNGEKVCELKCKYNLSGKCTCYGLCIAKDLFIEELEKIKEEIENDQEQMVNEKDFGKYYGMGWAISIIDNHITELKGNGEE